MKLGMYMTRSTQHKHLQHINGRFLDNNEKPYYTISLNWNTEFNRSSFGLVCLQNLSFFYPSII